METKSWAQYDSAGEIKHNLIVSKSRVLVFKGKDEKGETHFYNYSMGKEVKLSEHTSNYTTRSYLHITLMTHFSRNHGINYLFPNISAW